MDVDSGFAVHWRWRIRSGKLTENQSRAAAFIRQLALLACAALSIAPGVVLASSQPKPSQVDGRIASLAKKWFYRFQTGRIDRSALDRRINAQLTTEMIRSEAQVLQTFGTPKRFVYLGTDKVQYATGYHFLILFKNGSIIESIALDDDGKIGGIDFQPYTPNASQ